MELRQDTEQGGQGAGCEYGGGAWLWGCGNGDGGGCDRMSWGQGGDDELGESGRGQGCCPKCWGTGGGGGGGNNMGVGLAEIGLYSWLIKAGFVWK